MQTNKLTPAQITEIAVVAAKQREYVETFVEFYADFLRCLDEGVYKPKEGWEILAEECHYLYHTITKWDKEKEQAQTHGLVNMDGTVERFTGEY